MLHYNPRHVSSINMPIFRRTNCIITAPGIVTLCIVQYSMPDESRLLCTKRKKKIYYYFVPPEPGVLSMDRVHQSESAMLLENIP